MWSNSVLSQCFYCDFYTLVKLTGVNNTGSWEEFSEQGNVYFVIAFILESLRPEVSQLSVAHSTFCSTCLLRRPFCVIRSVWIFRETTALCK